jgi:hypothetical protein
MTIMPANTIVEIPEFVQNNLKYFFSHPDAYKKPLLIYSAGHLTQTILSTGLIDPNRVHAIFDRKKETHGHTINGITIVNPENLSDYQDTNLVILSNRYHVDIYSELKPICDMLNIELLDACAEQNEINFNELQYYYSDKGLYSAFEQINNRKYLWHVALPKSGSTWLTTIMRFIYLNKGWQVDTLTTTVGVQKQEIDPRYFFTKGGQYENIFFQHQHCAYSAHTRNLIVRSGTKCIVQLRGLFDVVISTHDYFRKLLQSNDPETVVLPQGALYWSDEYLFDYIIDMVLPWYISFVKGWLSSDLQKYGIISFVKYEELLKNPLKEIMKITNWAELNVTENDIRQAIVASEKAHTRKNKAQIGRGRTLLSKEQKKRIERQAAYLFPENSQLQSVL